MLQVHDTSFAGAAEADLPCAQVLDRLECLVDRGHVTDDLFDPLAAVINCAQEKPCAQVQRCYDRVEALLARVTGAPA